MRAGVAPEPLGPLCAEPLRILPAVLASLLRLARAERLCRERSQSAPAGRLPLGLLSARPALSGQAGWRRARRRYPDRTSGLRFWLAQGAFADQHFVGRAERVEPSRDPAIGCRVQ